MSITEVVNMVTAFAIATGTVSVPLALLGHALVASRFQTLQRIGKILEGIGWDLKRVSEAFKKGEPPKPKDPPDDPPNDHKPVGLFMLALAMTLTACGFGGPAEAADKVCAPEAAVAQARCLKVAFEKCGAYSEDPDACPRAAEVDAECDRFVREEIAQCN